MSLSRSLQKYFQDSSKGWSPRRYRGLMLTTGLNIRIVVPPTSLVNWLPPAIEIVP